MLISSTHRFLFIHVWKSGGTSIEQALAPYADALRKPFASGILRHLGFASRGIGKHAYAVDIRDRVGAETFNRMFRFAFVRNPWSWLASWYFFVRDTSVSPDTGRPWRHHLHSHIRDLDFPSFVRWATIGHGLCLAMARRNSGFHDKRPFLQSDWLTDRQGNQLVDFIGKFENIDADFQRLRGLLNLPGTVALPHANKGSRPLQSYRDLYDASHRDLVAEYFAKDIKGFGYDF